MQNANKSLNQLPCKIAKKNEFYGETIEIAVLSSIIEFNDRASRQQEVFRVMGMEAGMFTALSCGDQDRLRINISASTQVCFCLHL
jgi:hypothetical protein